jgi:energy-coupling factor transporter ATP-binding protein EcfA2
MRIKELNLVNFKRFTDLQIKNIPAEAKLVLLIGANGSGKSSIFDAFDWFMKNESESQKNRQKRSGRANRSRQQEDAIDTQGDDFVLNNVYYAKNNSDTVSATIVFDEIGEQIKAIPQNFEEKEKLPKNIFFGRPSMRIVPRLMNMQFDEKAVLENTDGPENFIDFDTRFHSDVKKYTWDVNKALRDPLFAGDTEIDLRAIMQKFITPVNASLERIFGKDTTTSIRIANYQEAGTNIAEPPRLVFSKGGSLINYDLLSHGEKQIIIILLNFIVRSKYFQDTIYYIDEMDVHLNTTLQYELLKEITENWIPKNCQLWTASHSLGFIEYAKDTEHSAILDFDNLDFDATQILEPLPKYQDEMFDIAVPRASLAKILGNRKIVLCENKNYELYSLMGLDDFIFTDVQNSNSVFLKIKRDKTLVGLRDRDFLTDNEIHQLTTKFINYKILRYYCFENYLYHPENVAQINLDSFDKDMYENEITAIKNTHRHALVLKISESRKAYEEFRDGGIKADSDIAHLSKCFESDDFETFFPFFSFKDYGGVLINKYKMGQRDIKAQLVQTEWFIGKIKDVLN